MWQRGTMSGWDRQRNGRGMRRRSARLLPLGPRRGTGVLAPEASRGGGGGKVAHEWATKVPEAAPWCSKTEAMARERSSTFGDSQQRRQATWRHSIRIRQRPGKARTILIRKIRYGACHRRKSLGRWTGRRGRRRAREPTRPNPTPWMKTIGGALGHSPRLFALLALGLPLKPGGGFDIQKVTELCSCGRKPLNSSTRCDDRPTSSVAA